MKQKKIKEDGEHDVHITIVIAKASLTDHDFDSKKNELPQVQNYFHCQYKLLPDDKDYVKTDVVTFGMAAKMYGDSDSKVLRTWLDGNKTWVAWTSNRKLRVTQDTLLKMFKHKLELKVWDTKDKVSAKARFDRPKAFRLPQAKANDEVDLDIIRSLLQQEGKTNVHLGIGLLSQSTVPNDDILKKDMSKKVSFNDNKSQVKITPKHSTSSNQLVATSDSKLEVQVRLDKNLQPEFKNLFELASAGGQPLAVDTIEKEDSVINPSQSGEKSDSSLKKSSKSRRRSNLGTNSTSSFVKKLDAEAEKVKQNGLASISIPLSSLFTNCTSISNNIKESVSTLEEVILIITLDRPLLSDRQREVLNPMVLTVGSAAQMPDNNMSFNDLAERTLPPYIQYSFHECPTHKSEETEHGRYMNFSDRNVILLGVQPKGRLYEYLRGPPLRIEIHDRDPKHIPVKKSLVFGALPHDNDICSVHYTDAVTSEADESSAVNISYGVAEFDLSELLSGERILHLIAPIRSCHQSSSSTNKNLGLIRSKASGIPAGDYLEFGSELKVKIELARSLTDQTSSTNATEGSVRSIVIQETDECPFNRMVYMFDYKNKAFLAKFLKEVTKINADALQLSSYPPHVIDAALSTYKLSDEQAMDKSLNIVTGCQVIDGRFHIFILEGLRDSSIKMIWNNLDHPQPKDDEFFRVLYNSEMSFAQRLYLSLDVDLTRVRLYQPLSDIVKQPLLYVRDMIPKLCFDAVTKLFQLCQCTSLHNAVRNEILPTAEMIVSLAKEFGVPLRPDDFHEVVQTALSINEPDTVPCSVSEIDSSNKSSLKKRQPLDKYNESYEKMLIERKSTGIQQKDYVNANIKSLVTLAQSKMKENGEKTQKTKRADIISKEVPPSIKQITRSGIDKTKDKWKTRNGFVFPGMKSAVESNLYPKPLHPARLQELELPWRENILHANVSKPTVQRMFFGWDDRSIDFVTQNKPPDFFGQRAPVTIHAAGDTLQNEAASIRKEEEKIWKNKMVVGDPQFKTYRCLPATEMMDKGSKASNQQARLQNILKDDPVKHSLAKKGMRLNPIPVLSVVSQPTQYPDPHNPLETNVGFNPGELEGLSLARDQNIISINNYDHEYFKQTKGYDFRLVHTDREISNMKVKPLTHEERDTHLFF